MDALSAAIPQADFTDGDVRWWVEYFGGHIPLDVRPGPWILVNGMPPELHELVASIRPS